LKLALITTPPSVRSGIGDYTRGLLPYLREHCDVQIFVDYTVADPTWEGQDVLTVDQLEPRRFDQILYQLGNERSHAFMGRLVRALGGTVMQHDWVLFDMALGAWPALARGGGKGYLLALREGGLGQAHIYSRNWLERRRQRRSPLTLADPESIAGELLEGWHSPEETGRWTCDRAALRIPDGDVKEVEIDFHADAGRKVRILEGRRALAEGGAGPLSVRPENPDHPLLVIETSGVRVSKEQRRHGDSRRLGVFVRGVVWDGGSGSEALDLSQPAAVPRQPVSLSRDRFLLPLNRSIVRFADAFIVHSRYVRDLILRERNAATPIGILHHGAEVRWHDEDRRETRRRLGLEGPWLDCFLITSFGGVQRHKRIEQALEALAVVCKQRDDMRLVLAGSASGEFDPVAKTKQLGLEDVVHFTGFVPEEVGWDWLHAGNVALNLRGPSSGGTSGGIFQAFSMGRPVIATDAAEQRELPDSCTVKIPLGESEIPELARTLMELADDPERLVELERGARHFVENECHWRIVAKRYAEHLASFPPARSARRSLVAR